MPIAEDDTGRRDRLPITGGRRAGRMPGAGACGIAVAALVALLACGCGGSDRPPPPVQIDRASGSAPLAGIEDEAVSRGDPSAAGRLAAMAGAGAKVVRMSLPWSTVAPTRPRDPANPADPAYVWGGYDVLVRAARDQGLQVVMSVWGTPAWAADPSVRRPAGDAVPPTAVPPRDPADFGAFARAAADHFTPLGVTRWEGWNEPNVPLFLYPQFARRGRRWVAVSPATYARLQRAFYAGVKAVAPDATVAGAVTAPTGDRADEPKPARVRPDDFIRALDAPGLRPPMDVVSHHPYPQRKPTDRTLAGRDYIDLYNLDALTGAIDATYLRGRDIWLTEYGFATEQVPEYPLTFTPGEQAAAIADAFRRIRADRRVTLSCYYLLRDHPGWRSGLLDLSGAAKPGEAAFALPLTRTGSGPVAPGAAVQLVGQARPAAGATTVEIEWSGGGGWRRLTSVPTGGDGSFALTIRPAATLSLRARWTDAARGTTWVSPSVPVTVAGAR